MSCSGVSKVGHGRAFALPIANDSVFFLNSILLLVYKN